MEYCHHHWIRINIMAAAPGKHYRKGMTLVEFMQMFPTEEGDRMV